MNKEAKNETIFSLQLARHIAIWPMAIGIGLALLAIPFPSERLASTGFWFVCLAVPVNLFGLGQLAFFRLNNRRNPEILDTWRRNSGITLVLLVLNYPVAYACIRLGMWAVMPKLIEEAARTSAD